MKILELLKKLYKYFTNKNKTHGVSSGEELSKTKHMDDIL